MSSGRVEQLIERHNTLSPSGEGVPVVGWSDDGSGVPVGPLVGRSREADVIARLLDGLPDRGGALVVRGEAGIGKSALLESAIRSASGFRVVRAAGVESEMELAFATLQQLCAPLLDRLGRLPGPQREALGVAFGLSAGHSPDRFLVGLAVLSLFSEAADEQPLLCVVDDAQWLDRASAQALLFVARRVLAESVALVFATRDPGGELGGLPELALEGLRNGDAHALLGSALGVPLDERVRERIVAETRGNPLALMELPRGFTPDELAGGYGFPGEPGLPGRIEDSFRRRLEALPAETQRLLLVAAAEPVGDPVLLWRAAGRLGIRAQAATETDGLLAIASGVTFRHPLVRSAVYRAASPVERRAVHRALADATDPEVDPDRRAWHLAAATPRPDEGVAAELERCAGRAQARGGLAAAAAFLEKAAALTLERPRRAERALAAAQAKHLAGAPDAALSLLAVVEEGPLDDYQSARVDLLRAEISFAVNRGSDAPSLLLKAAKRLEPFDVRLARETYLEAISAALFAGRLARGADALEVARAARSAPLPSQPPRVSDLLLDGLAVLLTSGYAAGAPMLKRALRAFRSEDIAHDEAIRWTWLACRAAIDVWDYDTWDVLSIRLLELIRNAGALAALPLALTLRMGLHLYAGELGVVAALSAEVEAATEATASQLAPYGALLLAAWQGREAEASDVIEATIDEVVPRGEALALTTARWATAVLYNGLGRYQDALAAAKQASERAADLGPSNWSLAELVEAAVRSGDAEAAVGALERLTQTTQPSGTDWGLGIEARSRALVSDGEAAERFYRQAIEALDRAHVRVELARAHLLYGEWLRRERRRLEAREELRTAHEMFTEMRVEAFAERARVELEATGARARKRTAETLDDLTPQEAQICRLAAEGATNQEIAAHLFISPSTVDYHLRKAFRKLGVKSRHQLKQHQLQPRAQAEPALRRVEPRTQRRPRLPVPVGEVG